MNDADLEQLKQELRNARSTIIVQRIVLVCLVLIVAVAAAFYLGRKSAVPREPQIRTEREAPVEVQPVPEAVPEESMEVQPEPQPEETGLRYENGQIMMYAADFERDCPLTVTVPDTDIFYVLVDYASQKSDMAFMVEPGGTAEVMVPEGWARIYYACGNAWHGNAKLFGDSTVCFETLDAFYFHKDNGDSYGYTIELILREDGNLPRKEISVEEFQERILPNETD